MIIGAQGGGGGRGCKIWAKCGQSSEGGASVTQCKNAEIDHNEKDGGMYILP